MTEIIAEIGLQHDGSLREALAFVRACAKRGVDCVKAQCHLADENLKFRPNTEHHFPQDESRFAYWQRTGFNEREWQRIKQECDDCGVEFLCTPFSVAAAEMINPLVKRWKVGSGNCADKDLLAFVGATGKPVLVSNGLDNPEYSAARWIITGGKSLYERVYEMQCVSEYPTPPHKIFISQECPDWGLSDHSGAIWPAVIAAWAGYECIEVHVCWSKEQGGPDVESAITIEELGQLVAGVRYVERMQGRAHELRTAPC